MGNRTPYQVGRQFEYRVKYYLEEKMNATVQRSYGSKGSYDLLAVMSGCVWFIQCKKTKDGYINPKGREQLLSLEKKHSIGFSYVCYPDAKNKLVFKRVEK